MIQIREREIKIRLQVFLNAISDNFVSIILLFVL